MRDKTRNVTMVLLLHQQLLNTRPKRNTYLLLERGNHPEKKQNKTKPVITFWRPYCKGKHMDAPLLQICLPEGKQKVVSSRSLTLLGI